MEDFRFAIMGAGNIAQKFCDAVRRTEGVSVAAVSSKSIERAQSFAQKQGIPKYYANYEEMLNEVKPDCVYVATTPDSHFALSTLCVEHDVPVICEKAMFVHERDAVELFTRAEKKGIFTMEAMWSRFLPANNAARDWLRRGDVGEPVGIDTAIGFIANPDPTARYLNPALCGGATTDITVYGYELTTWMAERPVKRRHIEAVKGETGVDVTETIMLAFEGGIQGVIRTSFVTPLKEEMVIYGTKGRIVIPHPHFANEAFLYLGRNKEPSEHFVDDCPNGFMFEVAEVMRCVREGRIESDVIPHKDTVECAHVFDEVYRAMEN